MSWIKDLRDWLTPSIEDLEIKLEGMIAEHSIRNRCYSGMSEIPIWKFDEFVRLEKDIAELKHRIQKKEE